MADIILLGVLLGLRHALDADHLAAVAALATNSPSVQHTARLGVAWGIGHTLTLLVVGAVVLAMDTFVPERLAQALEFFVGVMLVVLGVDVVRRVVKQRVHIHAHRHGKIIHVHAHAHSESGPHGATNHDHPHPKGTQLRAALVGTVHGMAGSAALLLLNVQIYHSFPLGLFYIGLFGVGSIVGMAACSVVIAWPLRFTARWLTWAHNGLQMAVALFTIGLGATLVYEIGIGAGLIL